MPEYRYRIGQAIGYRSFHRMRNAAPGEYRIVGYRPTEGDEALYRIKSDLERHERIARESELEWLR
jgi:hypothetical protein